MQCWGKLPDFSGVFPVDVHWLETLSEQYSSPVWLNPDWSIQIASALVVRKARKKIDEQFGYHFLTFFIAKPSSFAHSRSLQNKDISSALTC